MGILDRFRSKKAKPHEHENLASLWDMRLIAANKAYLEWEADYEPDVLMEYYKGFQWSWQDIQDRPQADHLPRVVNLFFPSVELIKPSLFFPGVRFKVAPRPARVSGDPLTQVNARAKLQEDTLNTFLSDPDLGFDDAVEMDLTQALFRFGVIEAGYTADFVDNPNAGKPVMRSDIEEGILPGADEQAVDPDTGEPLIQPPRVPENERLFVTRIPAKNFRAPADSKPRTEDNEFFAYYSWHRLGDVKSNKFFDKKSTEDLKATGSKANDSTYFEETGDFDETKVKMVKIWKVWDLRTMHKITLAEGHDRILRVEKFKKLPFSSLRFHQVPDSWYPIPVTWNWLPSQQELNETRAQQTEYRQRMIPKVIVDGQMADSQVIDALESRETGGIAIAKSFNPNGVLPIPLPSPNPQMLRSADEAKIDFREISGITGEQRGVSEAKTATQAQILDLNARAREDFRRLLVGRHISRIGRLCLDNIVEKVSLGFWVKTNVDLLSQGAFDETNRVAAVWTQIKADDLGPMSFDVSVDVASLSPVAEQQQRESWNQVLLLISNPQILGMLGVSETLMRKTLENYGIINESDIQEIFRVAQIVAQKIGMAQQPGGGPQVGGGAGGQPILPDTGQIAQQLENQIGLQNVV